MEGRKGGGGRVEWIECVRLLAFAHEGDLRGGGKKRGALGGEFQNESLSSL